MPGFDKTGPMGDGPMTGWCIGIRARRGNNCTEYSIGPGAGRSGWCGHGRGRRAGAGFGGGWGLGPPAQVGSQMAADDQLELLKVEAGDLKDALESINQRIERLELGQPEP